MSRVAKPCSSPLKRSDGTWATSNCENADVFASSFAPRINDFSDLSVPAVPQGPDCFLRLRTRTAQLFSSSLRADSGAGPDLVPAR
eukprot:3029499-Pyramimonas_sp.AAC.1